MGLFVGKVISRLWGARHLAYFKHFLLNLALLQLAYPRCLGGVGGGGAGTMCCLATPSLCPKTQISGPEPKLQRLFGAGGGDPPPSPARPAGCQGGVEENIIIIIA